jgi:endonuclease I
MYLTPCSYICKVKKNTILILLFLLSRSVFGGTIAQSVSSLSNFGNVYAFHSSTSQRYTVSGTSLTANLIVSGDNNFEVSLTYGYGYSKSVTITPTAGTVAATTIFVRFSPSSVGSIPGTINNTSTGSTTQTVVVTGTCIAWAIPASYYATVNTQRGAALKTVLYNKILGHTAVSYTPGVWNAYATTDVQPNGKVWDVYGTRFDQASPYEYTLVTGQCGTYSIEGDCYNREHSFPKSWFNDATPMYTELFHILASDGKVNGVRNNYPYGNVTTATYTSLYGGKLGTGPNNYGYSGIVFEPIDEYKGDLARGYFYMATRYENIIAGWTVNTGATDVLNGTSFPCFLPWQLSLLQEWNNLDPVSDKEVKRNNAIYAIQNNRNPFIDSPQFVQRIWGGNNPAEPTIAASNLLVTNNSNTSVTLNWKSGNGNRRIVMLRAGSPITNLPLDTIQYAANSNLAAAPQIGAGNYVAYNGTGSNVTITNLAQGTTYYYAVIEYNGWYTTANYQLTGYLNSNATTLPVDLTAFTATKQNETVLLNWNTASEMNNRLFSIERSYDAENWEEIGTVEGAGTSAKQTRYQFPDIQPLSSIGYSPSSIYYRLKQTDYDGKQTHSTVLSVAWNNTAAIVEVAPNPFTESLRISINSSESAKVMLQLQNLMGEKYVTEYMQPEYGKHEITLDKLGHLPGGIYILHIEQQQTSQYFKLIKR